MLIFRHKSFVRALIAPTVFAVVGSICGILGLAGFVIPLAAFFAFAWPAFILNAYLFEFYDVFANYSSYVGGFLSWMVWTAILYVIFLIIELRKERISQNESLVIDNGLQPMPSMEREKL
jgi:chromate transport protein ChrA